MSFIKHKVQFDFRPKGRQSGKFVGRNECLPAGKFAVTGIGNADAMIRSQVDLPGWRVRGETPVNRNNWPAAQFFNSVLELRDGGVYDSAIGQPLHCLFEIFWSVLAILCGENRTPTLLPGRKTKADGPLLA